MEKLNEILEELYVDSEFPMMLALMGRSLVLAFQSFDKDTAEHQKARDEALDLFVSEIVKTIKNQAKTAINQWHIDKVKDEGYIKAKNYHSLGKEIADLLKDPEAMSGLTLEKNLRKLGYVKIDKVKELVGSDELMDIVGMTSVTDSSFRGTMTEQLARRIAKAIRSSILNKLEKGE